MIRARELYEAAHQADPNRSRPVSALGVIDWYEAKQGWSASKEASIQSAMAFDTMLRGWALAEQGQLKEGISQLHKGMDAYRATGAKTLLPQWMVVLAELCGKSDQVEQGLAVLADLQPLADRNEGEHYYIAEMLRLKGQLLIQALKDKRREAAVYDEAETCFLRAIQFAQQQDAKSLELRAAMSLSRLWQSHDKKAEAFGLLSKIYNWFEEGFDTPDLMAAKVLLEELL